MLYEVAPLTAAQLTVTWLLPADTFIPVGVAGRATGTGAGVGVEPLPAPPPPHAASDAIVTPRIHTETPVAHSIDRFDILGYLFGPAMSMFAPISRANVGTASRDIQASRSRHIPKIQSAMLDLICLTVESTG
jgi:hypothetical protein